MRKRHWRGGRARVRDVVRASWLVPSVLLGAVATSASAVSCGPPKAHVQTLSTTESWCPEGFEVGPQDTCFAVPETTDKDTPILVYLHGMYTGHGSAEEWSLVRSAVARGFAVVIPRGKRGLCAWKAELQDHFCWPSEVDDPQAYANVVAEWNRVLWQVEQILEGGPHKRFVLGFSNGGYFASYLALHGIFPAERYAVVNGGSLEPSAKPARPPPLLLVTSHDDTEQGPRMRELHDGLLRTGWMHVQCTRKGAHPLAKEDMDAALRFFRRELDTPTKPPTAGYACEGAAAEAPSNGPAGSTSLRGAVLRAPNMRKGVAPIPPAAHVGADGDAVVGAAGAAGVGDRGAAAGAGGAAGGAGIGGRAPVAKQADRRVRSDAALGRVDAASSNAKH